MTGMTYDPFRHFLCVAQCEQDPPDPDCPGVKLTELAAGTLRAQLNELADQEPARPAKRTPCTDPRCHADGHPCTGQAM
jgi:hypothetical protein